MTVHVVLIDATTDTTLGAVDLAPTQLPESFAASTTLHLGGVDWQVARAEPMTREAYTASGALTIWLHRVTSMAPADILFSLPTLETLQPPTTAATGPSAWMHEDDWRQRELVSAAFAAEIAAEFAEIRAVLDHHRVGAAFKHLHVRTRIPSPLGSVALTLADLGLDGPPCAVTLGPAAASDPPMVVGGFAYPADGVYGRAQDGRVVTLGLSGDVVPPTLVTLARAHDLRDVDWLGVAVRAL